MAIRRQIRSRLHVPLRKPSAAMVVAILALILSVAGNAAAAIIISSNAQVAAHTIAGAAAKKSDHQNLIPGSVGAPDLANAAITAAKLASDARSHKIDFSATGEPEDTKTTLLHLDELTISGECNATNSSATLTIVGKSSVSGQLAGSIIDGSASSPSLIDYALAAGGSAPMATLASNPGVPDDQIEQYVYRNAARVITVSLHALTFQNTGNCQVAGTAVVAAAK